MKRTAIEHPKVRRLQRILGGIPRWQAWGLMEGLWQFTGKFTPRGDVGRYQNEDLADFLEWREDPDVLVDAYIKAGLIDPHPEHRLVVHGWHEHADDATKAALRRANDTFVMCNDGVETCPDGVTTAKALPEPEPEPCHAMLQKPVREEVQNPPAAAPPDLANLTDLPGGYDAQALLLLNRHRGGAIFNFTGADTLGRSQEEWLSQVGMQLRNGRAVTDELILQAVEQAKRDYAERGGGKPKTIGWVLKALVNLLNDAEANATQATPAAPEDPYRDLWLSMDWDERRIDNAVEISARDWVAGNRERALNRLAIRGRDLEKAGCPDRKFIKQALLQMKAEMERRAAAMTAAQTEMLAPSQHAHAH